MLTQGNARVIPNYISAPSPQRLRALMFVYQSRLGIQFSTHPPQFANGRWYVWFQEEISTEKLEKLLAGKISKKEELEGGL